MAPQILEARYSKARPCGQAFESLMPITSNETYPVAYTLNDEPQPQVDFTCGFSNLKPAASSVST